MRSEVVTLPLLLCLAACGGESTPPAATGADAASVDVSQSQDSVGPDVPAVETQGGTGTDITAPAKGVVYVVLFTHIEDNTPGGALGSEQSRKGYLALRAKLLEMAKLAQSYSLPWVLQPDWKYLEVAKTAEDAATRASTGGRNLFVALRDDYGVAIDPHSHEKGGYNYTDVAHLLTGLGVGESTVIGGHIWDPALPQFQAWDRFRAPIAGEHYPTASWRGDILIGAGTPNHTNDPIVTGVWRPKDRDHYFTDDPAGNIVSIGAWTKNMEGVQSLVDLYAAGTVPASQILTASWNLRPDTLTSPTGLADIEATVLKPLAALRDAGTVVVTDFATLVATWKSTYGAKGLVYRP